MRHQNKKGRLSRNISLRKATLKSMANSLFLYQKIETTKAKAKALRSFAEPLITIAKKNPGSIAARRQIFKKLCNKDTVKFLFDDLAPLYKDIPGGYTRIMPLGTRRGDGASLVIMELTKKTVEEEVGPSSVKKAASKARKTKAKAGKDKAQKTVKKDKVEEGLEKAAKSAHTVAPDITAQEKEEHFVEDVRKEKAKTEQKKMTQKKGIFRRFQRKSMG